MPASCYSAREIVWYTGTTSSASTRISANRSDSAGVPLFSAHAGTILGPLQQCVHPFFL